MSAPDIFCLASRFLLGLKNGDVAFCVSADAGQAVLRIGAKSNGHWQSWTTIDTTAIKGGDLLSLAVILTEYRLQLQVGQEILFNIDRPENLSQSLNLYVSGSFSRPTLGFNKARAAELDALVRPTVSSRGLGSVPQPDLVFDIGLHIGQDTDFYLKKGFRVVAIEANPMLARVASDRFERSIKDGRLTILNFGLAGFAGQFPFYVNERHSEWSSFDREVASRGHPVQEMMVPTVTIGTVLEAFGVPHFMKIDIEAYDRFVIEGLEGRGLVPSYLSIENGPVEQFELLVRLGYRRFKLVEQSALNGTRAMMPSLEGASVEHVFPMGSSGPFGAESPGAWLDTETMRIELARHHATQIPEFHWFDLHASLA